jgi:hypothetical protein
MSCEFFGRSILMSKLSELKTIAYTYIDNRHKIKDGDLETINKYTNQSIQEKYNKENFIDPAGKNKDFPKHPPLLFRQFRRDENNKNEVDQLEAFSNVKIEYTKNLSKYTFTIEEIKHMILNMNILAWNKNTLDLNIHINVLFRDVVYELRYDGSFYLYHIYTHNRIDIPLTRVFPIEGELLSNGVFLNLSRE